MLQDRLAMDGAWSCAVGVLLVLLPPHGTYGAEGKCSGQGLNLDFYLSENFVISADVMCSKAVKSLLFVRERRKMDLLISVSELSNTLCLQLISG